jgi:NhaP-type Na+/H+ or K+/H+ antiporter
MGDDADNQEQDSPQVDLILFMFLGLCVGIVLEQVISRTTSSVVSNIPPTVCLFLVGLAMAGYSKAQLSDGFNESLNGWVRIDAQLMLFLFLPPLVFGEAMYLNWHHAKKVFPQAMTLAGPGVLLGSSFMAMFAKIILPYDWDWLVCLLFGSVLGATDTVAVLSIMNNAGASPKLTILIVGESLLNDGTSVVLFEACLTLLQAPDSMSIGEWIFFVIKMTIGSTLLGGLIGLFTVRWLRSVNRPLKEIDTTSQIAITLTVAYLTFFLAQHVFEISGLLALVAAAVMLSWLAPPIILNRETMHNIWSFVEWVGNTTIFLLAGLIIGHRVLGDVQGIDWMYMILLYVFK